MTDVYWDIRDKMLEPYIKAYLVHNGYSYPDDAWVENTSQLFKLMPTGMVSKLISLGYLRPENSYRGSPKLDEIFEFMQLWPFVFAMGYVVSRSRADAKVVIDGFEGVIPEGIDKVHFEKQLITKFAAASEFELNKNGYFSVWWC